MDLIDREKDLFLTKIFRILASLGVLAFLPGAYAAVMGGFFVLAGVNTAVYAIIVALSVFPRIPYLIRLYTLIALSYTLAAGALLFTGHLGVGYGWLMAAVLTAALFGGKGTLYAAIAITVAGLSSYALALEWGLEGFGKNPFDVAITGFNLLTVCVSLAVIIRLLLDRLSESLQSHRLLVARLSQELTENEAILDKLARTLEEKEVLLQEVQHRVNNNMQTILSLMDIDGVENNADRTMRRRIRTLSTVNELLYVHRDSVEVNLVDMVRATAGMENEDANWGGAPEPRVTLFQDNSLSIFLKPQAAIMTAICFGDALSAVLSWGKSARIDIAERGPGGIISIRAEPGTDTRRAEETLRDLELGHLGRAASDYLEFSFLPPGSSRGPGISLELR